MELATSSFWKIGIEFCLFYSSRVISSLTREIPQGLTDYNCSRSVLANCQARR